MNKIVYAAAAIKDLEEVGDYISLNLGSPKSALNTVGKIQSTIDKLADFPLSGAKLSSITDVESEYRFLICGNYIAFYQLKDGCVCINRILYGKQDYVSVLFPNI